MYEQLKQQFASNTTMSSMPLAVPARQVDGMLDSVNFSLDALGDVANDLICRLEPVTGGFPSQDEKPSCSSSLVPIAARISYANSRIVDVTERLKQALNALEI